MNPPELVEALETATALMSNQECARRGARSRGAHEPELPGDEIKSNYCEEPLKRSSGNPKVRGE